MANTNPDAVRRGGQAIERGTFEIVCSKTAAKIGDYPLFSLTFALLIVLMMLGMPDWVLIVALTVGIAAMVHFRRGTKARRQRRRIARAWSGTPERAGHAANLGLINPSGEVPRIAKYATAPDGLTRTVRFDLPTGITSDALESKSLEVADVFGALRAGTFTKVKPGVVEILLIDVDTIATARDADWLPADADEDVTKLDSAADFGAEKPWWEQENGSD